LNFKDPRAKELFGHYPDRILTAFKTYHLENPQIYKRFRELSYKMRRTKRKRYGARTIIEVIRWETDLRGAGDFKINNNYNALYARLLILKHPEFEGFFEIRDYDFENKRPQRPIQMEAM